MLSKTILITGATSGIGTETALALAKQGHVLYLLVRDVDKGERLKSELIAQTTNNKITIIRCDLTDLQSVHDSAVEIKKQLTTIHVLINNAGGIFAEREVSTDGFEMTFALNHLGHFLLTLSLMLPLQKGHGRVINVSSDAHRAAKADLQDLQMQKSYSSIRAYGNAKLFNIYFTRSIAERFSNKGVTAFCLHPGTVNTGFGNGSTGVVKFLLRLARPFMLSHEQGARTSVFLATEPHIEQFSGQYFKKGKVARSSAASNNNVARQELWMQSEAWVKTYL